MFGASLASVLAYDRIEPAARIAVHWNIHGVADRFAGRLEAALLLPVIMLTLMVIFLVVSRTAHGRRTQSENASAWIACWAGGFIVMLTVHVAILSQAMSASTGFSGLAPVLLVVSLVLIWIGNVLPKTRPNYFVGVRTPSTLSDRGAWGAANRFAGWTFVLTGLATLAVVAASNFKLAIQVLVAGSLVSVLIAVLIGWLSRSR